MNGTVIEEPAIGKCYKRLGGTVPPGANPLIGRSTVEVPPCLVDMTRSVLVYTTTLPLDCVTADG